MLHDLKDAGYAVEGIPRIAARVARSAGAGRRRAGASKNIARYRRPAVAGATEAVEAAVQTIRHGESLTAEPAAEMGGSTSPRLSRPPTPQPQGGRISFPFRAATFGNVTVALAPDRGRSADRRADYHDPTLPPRHELVAFGLWLRESLGCHALVHVGAHGTLEWLPGKTVALSKQLLPRDRHRLTAGRLSLHRLQSRRGRTGQAPHRSGDARPPAAADSPPPVWTRTSRSSSGWSTNMRRPTGSTAAAATGWRS